MSLKQNPANAERETPIEASFAPLPRPGRRWGAAIIDLLLFIVLFLASFYGAVQPILKATVDLNEHQQAYYLDIHNSHLYAISAYVDKDGKEVTVEDEPYAPTYPNGAVGFKGYTTKAKYDKSEAIYRFYTEYKLGRVSETADDIKILYSKTGKEVSEKLINFRLDENAIIEKQLDEFGLAVEGEENNENTIDPIYITVKKFKDDPLTWFNERVLQVGQPVKDGEPLFVWALEDDEDIDGLAENEEVPSETTSEVTSEKTPVVKQHFLPQGVKIAEGKEETVDAYFENLYSAVISKDFQMGADYQIVNQYVFIGTIIALSFSSLIVYLLFPLVFKHGATLGKKMLGLGVVNTYGYKAKWWQHVARYFGLYLFTLLLDFIIISYGILSMPIITFISFTMGMFGKKNRALHDFIAGTRPVNLKEAKIYNSYEDELLDNPLPEKEPEERPSENTEWVNFEDRIVAPPSAPSEVKVSDESADE